MATPLEQFVHSVRTLSSQGNFRELVDLLHKSTSTELLIKNAQHLDTVLETFDLQCHSLAMLEVLGVKLSYPPQSVPPSGSQTQAADYQEILFTQVQEFINGCVAQQIRFSPGSYAELCHIITRQLIEAKSPIRGIELLSTAIRKLQTHPSELTLIHADLCQLCLLAKCFKPALKVLNQDITSISTTDEGVQFESKYFLLYYYYGGMIYTAMKNYDRALYMFEVVISTPAMAVSHIMLEAYKKYILVSLILHGKVLPMPKYTSQIVGRFMKPLSQAYHDLAVVYATNNTEELKLAVSKYAETITRDNNMGLTKQVVFSLYKKNIQRLTKTFLTLSLSDVASRVQLNGPSEAERYILNMIDEREIFATINQKDGMVIFHDDPEKYNSPGMLCKLEDEMTLCTDLDKRIQKMEEEILVNPQYVKKACGTTEDDLTQGTKLNYIV
ncbi:COP9 signalosome complex subunit 3 isoform X2 [Cimex lectularius]|uniref:COP9 signalosome complex subunit 3 n=1 Tax=Cimex lectularius TaxID=79782 RepID=A0A8I6RBQ1_CIMLE|nr:COP9 signalosome complex subunit 3 isoform X2 [Cimex lectularius]